MLDAIMSDNAPEQAVNVACLPGIVGASLAMPDIHWGYGFPIGGVAAFDMDEGVVSPGGVGYDINCGVRLMVSDMTRDEVAPKVQNILNALFAAVPTGVGAGGDIKVTARDLRRIAVEGSKWSLQRGMGVPADADHTEENGCMAGADPDAVSDRAWRRAEDQVGTLGSGNHFLEVGYVAEIHDEAAARAFGLAPEQVTVFIHCGSRGFGHQVCGDSLEAMDRAARKYGIELQDRQLACAPLRSPEAQAYMGAMRCAVNYAFANRQAIAHRVRDAFGRAVRRSDADVGLRTLYEVAHNIAKIETHTVDGKRVKLCVHRKGATRAFAAGSEDVPIGYREVGQPVLVPGDMGRCSYVLVGAEKAMRDTFGSACHGAGRLMSRHQAVRKAQGRNIIAELGRRGIAVMAHDRRTISEEMPEAYKDVSNVVEACEQAGIARRVARLQPLGCIKG
jgi:tRNA-splicing ligase RtcB